MTLKNKLYKATIKGMSLAMSRRIDLPEREPREELTQVTVTDTQQLAPQLRRITLEAELFQNIDFYGADEYIGLIMPKPGKTFELPNPEILNIRSAIKGMPVNLRWYTVRLHHKNQAKIDLDIVTHGTSGPGSIWALTTKVGDLAGVRLIGSCHYQHEGPQLYVADPTAAPALRNIVASLPNKEKARTHVLLQGTNNELEPNFPESNLASFNRNIPISEYIKILPFDPATLEYAWLCGESSLATGMRRALVAKNVPKQKIMFSGYWKQGIART
ncbi:Vibriobactin utilization protein ViuB [Corynebacterium freiburgense]|nr:Vibriobactin utilization protein ViuB [Corynebacterium freiburgense]